jgi:hypothetical protein
MPVASEELDFGATPRVEIDIARGQIPQLGADPLG